MRSRTRRGVGAGLGAALLGGLLVAVPVSSAAADEVEVIGRDTTEWRYLDTGVDPAGEGEDLFVWTEPDFDDSTWESASGPFGSMRGEFEDPMHGSYPVSTHLNQYYEGTTDNIEAFFFRTTIELGAEDLDELSAVTGTIHVDDAAKLFVNGVEVAGFADGRFDPAAGTNMQYVGGNEVPPITERFSISPEHFTEGENTIAISLYNTNAGSSDIYLDLESLALVTGTSGLEHLEGTGSPGDPYQVGSAEDLVSVSEAIDADPGTYAGAHYRLVADVDLAGAEFPPIETFSGIFEGAGHVIDGLTLSDETVTGDTRTAFIRRNSGVIRNVTFAGFSYSSRATFDGPGPVAAAIVGQNDGGTVQGNAVTGAVIDAPGLEKVAGIVGQDHGGQIVDNYFQGEVTARYMPAGVVSYVNNQGQIHRNLADAQLTVTQPGGERGTNAAHIATYPNGANVTRNVALGGDIDYEGPVEGYAGRIIGWMGFANVLTLNENLGSQDILIAGQRVDGAHDDQNGETVGAADLSDQATYEELGWDFASRWAWDDSRGHPVPSGAGTGLENDQLISTLDTEWRYDDSGVDPAEGHDDLLAWTEPDFDDSAWSTGVGSFGSLRGQHENPMHGYPVHNHLDQYYDGTTRNKEAFFFRTTVELTEEQAGDLRALTGTIHVDDAARIYVNGEKAAGVADGRFDPNAGTNMQYAGGNSGPPITSDFLIEPDALVAGENTIAISVHNTNETSSDIFLELEDLRIVRASEPVEVNDLVMNVGADETQRNLAWTLSVPLAGGMVQWAPASAMEGEEFPEEEALSATPDAGGATYHGRYYQHATIDGLEENETYVYRVGAAGHWSEVNTFSTGEFGAEDWEFLMIGDAQIGASRNPANDGAGWRNTLNVAEDMFPDAELIHSAGDQVESHSNAYEYEQFLSPEQLTEMPIATVIGNHDHHCDCYRTHFNMPNVDPDLGYEVHDHHSGGNDWYMYNDVLVLNLNSNTHGQADSGVPEHAEFIERVIAEHGDEATWIVASFHHSIYSVAHHSINEHIVRLRNSLAPVLSENGVDVVLMGHDHSYSRSRVMQGREPVEEWDGQVDVHPEEGQTVYVTGNSSSGSKYYDIRPAEVIDGADPEHGFNYMEEAWQGYVPSFAHIEVTGETMSVRSYRTDNREMFDEVVVHREADEEEPAPEREAVELTVDPDSLEIEEGESAELTATALFDDGEESVVTAQAEWSVADESVASVQAGEVTGLEAGETVVTVSFEELTAEAAVTVNAGEPGPDPTDPDPTDPDPTDPDPTDPDPTDPPGDGDTPPGDDAPARPELNVSSEEVEAGGTVRVTGTGFPELAEVTLELRSDPVGLEVVTADADGAFDVTVTIPADVQAGEHELVAILPSGEEVSVALTVTAPAGGPGQPGTPGAGSAGTGEDAGTPKAGGGLPSTGAEIAALAAGAALLLLLGVAAAASSRRRRAERTEA